MERLITTDKMANEERKDYEDFLKKAEVQIDMLNDGSVVFLDFDETIVIHDEEGRMTLNPLILSVVKYAKSRKKEISFALLTSTPRFVWNEEIPFPRILVNQNIRRRPFMELFEEEAEIEITEEIYADEQIETKSIRIEKSRLLQLAGEDLEKVAEKMYKNLLNMNASPLDSETTELVEKMKEENFPPEDIVNLLLNSAVKLRYLIVQKEKDNDYRFKSLREFLVFDDKRAGGAGEAFLDSDGARMAILVPRSDEERAVYEDVMRWEDVLLKTYSALFDFGIAPELSPSRVHVNESDTEVYVGERARKIKNSITLISLLESLNSEEFTDNPEDFYRYLISQSEELGKERVYVNIILPDSEVLVKLDLARLMDLAGEKDKAIKLKEAIERLSETLILSIERKREDDPVHLALNESLKDKILSKVYIGYQIGD